MLQLMHFLAGVLALASIASGLSYTNVSEVPYYGLSPPVYPTRKYFSAILQEEMLTATQRKVLVATMHHGKQPTRRLDPWWPK